MWGIFTGAQLSTGAGAISQSTVLHSPSHTDTHTYTKPCVEARACPHATSSTEVMRGRKGGRDEGRERNTSTGALGRIVSIMHILSR